MPNVTRYIKRLFPSFSRSLIPSVISKIELINVDNKILRICEGSQATVLLQGHLDGVICSDSAKFLCQYISDKQKIIPFRRKMVVELGSGTGLVGIASAVFGANAILTDYMPKIGILPYFSSKSTEILKLMNQNILINSGNILEGIASMSLLEWGNLEHIQKIILFKPIDYILGSDITYDKKSLPKLMNTVDALSSPETITLISAPKKGSNLKQLEEEAITRNFRLELVAQKEENSLLIIQLQRFNSIGDTNIITSEKA